MLLNKRLLSNSLIGSYNYVFQNEILHFLLNVKVFRVKVTYYIMFSKELLKYLTININFVRSLNVFLCLRAENPFVESK